METHMNCTNCQREIPDNIKFCPHCGQPVQIKKTKGKAKKVILALVLSFVILASFIGYRIYSSHNEEEKPSIEYKYLNGITYCTDGVIYVDPDITDDSDPYVLGTEDEELVDECSFIYLSTFSPDTSTIFYIADMEEKKTEVCGSLYSVKTEDITSDADETRKRSTLIAKDVSEYYVPSGRDNGVLYQNVDEELYFYSDYGNEYLMDIDGISDVNCIYNYGSSHILLTLKEGKKKSSTSIYIGSGYDVYHYDSATQKLSIIDDDASIPVGKYNKLVYTKNINNKTNSLDMCMSEITDDGIKTTKIDEDVNNIDETYFTDDITHITYTKKGEHYEDDYTYDLFTYDNGTITELGEIDLARTTTEYVTFFNYYEPDDEKKNDTQYYTTGTSEVFESPFTKVLNAQVAIDEGKILIQALNEDSVSCVYLCDVAYGKEISNIQMVAYNACVSGSYSTNYLFYAAGEKTRNLYISGDGTYKLMMHSVPSQTSVYVKTTPVMDDNAYFFLVNLLDYDTSSSIYDIYIRDNDRYLSRVETMVENIMITGKGAVYTKDKALYYYSAETNEVEKIADSTYYYEVGNKYETSIPLSTYIY